ncbi:HHL187Cp [Eremothecium sinecaudum]|uniref:HHL187Cp n=1 Tax=Eremothecium sinecaudum TaxID=45286 RepID=A0A0X8HWA1_9SACH|nr:HHL187Cp [Eremothecium sinecaudum]AMD22583.1 HHL187Cp [Eremothecium sinecaudum]
MSVLYVNKRIRCLVPKLLVSHLGLKVEIRDPDQYLEEWSKNFPLRKVPCLITATGAKLTEVIPIMIYLLKTSPDYKTRERLLHTSDLSKHTLILMYLSLANTDFCINMATMLTQIKGEKPYDKNSFEEASKNLDAITDVYEKRLSNINYLAETEEATLADLFTAAIFRRCFEFFYGAEWRNNHPAITKWFYDVIELPIMSPYYQDFKACDIAMAVPAISDGSKPEKKR